MRTFIGMIALLVLAGAVSANAEQVVKEQLEKLKNAGARIETIKDESLARTFPNHDFIAVIFPQFPVARLAPEPFKSSNIYAITKDAKVTLINDARGLEKLFATLRVEDKEPVLKDLIRSWLRLGQELYQDGFYQFQFDPDSFRNNEGQVSGKVVLTEGGNGKITATLIIKEGRVTLAKTEADIKRGMRPRCQATLLLDANPLVRELAEQDLLVMGRSALPYLAEQHAKAAPELRKAIERVRQRILAGDR